MTIQEAEKAWADAVDEKDRLVVALARAVLTETGARRTFHAVANLDPPDWPKSLKTLLSDVIKAIDDVGFDTDMIAVTRLTTWRDGPGFVAPSQ